MKRISVLAGLVFLLLLGSAFLADQKKPWIVPEADKKKVNPIKADASSLADGKELWLKHCQSCHGKTGKGDGSKSKQLKTEPGDFSSDSTQLQTDGALYYKTVKGRDDMPGFKKKIPESDDIWSIVNYMRTMKKKK